MIWAIAGCSGHLGRAQVSSYFGQIVLYILYNIIEIDESRFAGAFGSSITRVRSRNT